MSVPITLCQWQNPARGASSRDKRKELVVWADSFSSNRLSLGTSSETQFLYCYVKIIMFSVSQRLKEIVYVTYAMSGRKPVHTCILILIIVIVHIFEGQK